MAFYTLMEDLLARGATAVASLSLVGVEPEAPVRDACAQGRCGHFGRNWMCPPACGTLDACRSILARFSRGVLVQTTHPAADGLDFDGMMAGQRAHASLLRGMRDALTARGVRDVLVLGAGPCLFCAACSYPYAPCTHPGQALMSMEALGLDVYAIIKRAGLRVLPVSGAVRYYGIFCVSAAFYK